MRMSLLLVVFTQVTTVASFAADNVSQQPQSTTSEQFGLSLDGTIRVNHSSGNLTIEGWNRPEVEVTITKSTGDYYAVEQRARATNRLQRISVVTNHASDQELTISTTYPRHLRWTHPLRAHTGVTLEYRIHAPRNASLVIRHGTGQITIGNMTGPIQADGGRGDIVLMLPEEGRYSIDAKSKFGTVISDFAGSTRAARYLVGQRYSNVNALSTSRIYLRIGFGGITVKSLPSDSQ